jgi:hypothetical protein
MQNPEHSLGRFGRGVLLWPPIPPTLHQTVPRAPPECHRSTSDRGSEVLRRGSPETTEGCELGEEGAQGVGEGWGMAVFVAKVEIIAHRSVGVRALRCRHPAPVEPPLKGRRYLCENLLHDNVYG